MTERPAAPAIGVLTREPGPLHLLVWDAPNLDMGLSELVGRIPRPAERPRFDAVARWLLQGAGDEAAEACCFINVAPGAAPRLSGWVKALRSFGWSVFAKPKTTPESDVDDDVLAHVEHRRSEGPLARLVVASGDGRAFAQPAERWAAEGVEVVVLGYAEEAGWALGSEAVTFLDLEELPDVFEVPLPRARLDALPEQGAWLAPARPLRDLLS